MSVEIVDNGAGLDEGGDTVDGCGVDLLYPVLSVGNAVSSGVGDEECGVWYWIVDVEGADDDGLVFLQ